MHGQSDSHVKTWREEAAVCKPGIEGLEETKPADTLTSLQSREKMNLLLKLLSLWLFIMAALGNLQILVPEVGCY